MEGARNRIQKDFRSNLAEHLFKYTAVMSCQKIRRRITNNLVSRPYIESLQKVKTIPPLHISSESHGPAGDARHKEETTNDHLLLRFILASEDASILKTSTPNLLALASLLASHDPGTPFPFPIYNNKTSMEFHQLLLELLTCFEKAVVELCYLSGLENFDTSQFTNALTDAQVYGYGLLKVARGQGFRMHMENIAPSLNKPDHANAGAPVPVSNANNPGEEQEPEEDEELKALELVLQSNRDKDGTLPRKTLAESYVNWLRLTVAHFDAIEIVIQYVMSSNFQHNDISITNLVAPLSSAALYPWQELITNYLPTADPADPADPASAPTSNVQIVDFLNEAMTAAVRATKFSNLANAALAQWNNHHGPAARQKLVDMIALQDADINRIAEPVVAQLKKRKSDDVDKDVVTQGIQDLHRKLSYLPPGTSFFAALSNLQFTGALHCEASLASIINIATKIDATTDTTTNPVLPGSRETEETEAFHELLQQLSVIKLFNLFLPKPHLFSFFVIKTACWTSTWGIKTVLSSMLCLPRPAHKEKR
jgi:hypothetical protein